MNLSLQSLSDLEVFSQFREVIVGEHENLVAQLDFISELERRKLYFQYSSLWALLIGELKMAEWTAETRILASQMMRRLPEIREGLLSGRFNLSLMLMAQGCANRERLSDEELSDLLDGISGMTCRRARKEIATRYPRYKEEIRDRVRPIDAENSEVRFVASDALLEKIEVLRGLLGHSHPGASLAELFDVAVSEYIERHHPVAQAERAKDRASCSPVTERVDRRFPSAAQVHQMTLTQGYQCQYVDGHTGMRCESAHALEIDHVQSWASGGKTEVSNLRYLCANHHARVSFLEFGDLWKDRL